MIKVIYGIKINKKIYEKFDLGFIRDLNANNIYFYEIGNEVGVGFFIEKLKYLILNEETSKRLDEKTFKMDDFEKILKQWLLIYEDVCNNENYTDEQILEYAIPDYISIDYYVIGDY